MGMKSVYGVNKYALRFGFRGEAAKFIAKTSFPAQLR